MQERHRIFAERLRIARRRVKLSQVALAQACGVDRKTVKRWEAGEAIPSWATARALVLILRVSGWWLAGLSEDPTFLHANQLNSAADNELLAIFRSLSASGQEAALQMIKEARDAIRTAQGPEVVPDED